MSNVIHNAGRSIYKIVFRGKSISKSELAVFPFLILALLIFCNLNGVLFTVVGISSLGSPLMLVCSAAIFLLLDIKTTWFNKYYLGWMIFFASFLVLGWASFFLNYGENFVSFSGACSATRTVLTDCIIITTFYVYAMYRSKSVGVDNTVFDFYIFFLIALLVGVFEEFLGLRQSLYLTADPNRALGFFGNPNETGYQANLTLILSMFLFLRKRVGIVFFTIASSFCCYGAMSSFSKGAMITLAVLLFGFIVYMVFNIVRLNSTLRKQSISFLAVLTIGVFLLGSFVIVPYIDDLTPGQIKRVESVGELILEQKFNRKTSSARSGVFADAIVLISNKPITGYGLYSFSKGGLFQSSPTHGVHNLFLRFAGEGGILLLLLFILLLLFYFYEGIFTIRREVGVIFLLFIGSVALYSLASHSTLDKKFIMGLLGLFLCIVDRRLSDNAISLRSDN